MEQSALPYWVGIVGVEASGRREIERNFNDVCVSHKQLTDADLDLMLGRSVFDRNLIGVVAGNGYFDKFSDASRKSNPDFFIIDYDRNSENLRNEIVRSVNQFLGRQVAFLARNLTAAFDELSELRRMFDGLQRASVEVDRYLSKHALIRPQTLFSTQVGAATASLSSGSALRQHLPHDPYGFCAVGLHLASPLTSRSALEVEFCLGQEVAYRWSVRGPLQRGRLLLSLPRAMREEYREPSLLLKAHDDNRDPVELALAYQRAPQKWSAKLDDAHLEFPLAFELDFAPPGTTVTPRVGSSGSSTDADADSSRALLLDSWSEINYQFEPVRHDWQLVVAEDGTLQAHPLQNAMTVVHLGNLEYDGVRRLRADIRLAHEQAPRVGFALALVPKGRRRPLNLKDTNLGWAAKKTSWFELSGKAQGYAVLDIDPGELEGMSVALITACLDRRAEFAWARWGSIVLER